MEHPSVFISYSRKDEKEKDELLSHLAVIPDIYIWSDDQIGAGADWEQEIEDSIAQAKVAILLVTANFLSSDFIRRKEVPRLLERQQKEGLTIIPVIARYCAWQRVSWLNQMNVRPRNADPVWRQQGVNVDEDLATIADEVASIVMDGSPKSIPPPSGVKSRGKPAARVRDVPEIDDQEERQIDLKGWIDELLALAYTIWNDWGHIGEWLGVKKTVVKSRGKPAGVRPGPRDDWRDGRRDGRSWIGGIAESIFSLIVFGLISGISAFIGIGISAFIGIGIGEKTGFSAGIGGLIGMIIGMLISFKIIERFRKK